MIPDFQIITFMRRILALVLAIAGLATSLTAGADLERSYRAVRASMAVVENGYLTDSDRKEIKAILADSNLIGEARTKVVLRFVLSRRLATVSPAIRARVNAVLTRYHAVTELSQSR